MDSELLRTRVVSSLIWKFLERGGTQGIQFIVSIVLARLLVPEDYGMIALVLVFTSIASVFVQSGFNTALIQKKDADELDFSSVFYSSLAVAIILYMVLFFSAPYIADFYGLPRLVKVLRVLSFSLILGAVNSIQNAIVSRRLLFRLLFFRSIVAILVSGAIGITMAYAGYGVWALVAQSISNQLIVAIILWLTLRWRPLPLFSLARMKQLFSFGWKLLVSSLLDTAYEQLRSLVVGKMYDSETLGFYSRGQQFPSLIVSNVDGSIGAVMFPVLASQQDDKLRAKNMMRRSILTSSFAIFPLMVGLAITAEPIVRIMLTDKWLPSVPYIRIYCAVFSLMPIHTANLQAINAVGRSDIFLKLEVLKKVIGLIILFVTAFLGVYAIALGGILSGVLSSFINAYPNKHLLEYSYDEQVADILPSLALSVFMGIIVYSLKWIGLSTPITLVVQVVGGGVVYLGVAKLLKMESYVYLISTFKLFFQKRKGMIKNGHE